MGKGRDRPIACLGKVKSGYAAHHVRAAATHGRPGASAPLLSLGNVYAEDTQLVEERVERRAQRLRGRQVAVEGLPDNNARAAGAARLAKRLDHAPGYAGRDCQIVERVRSAAQFFAQRGVRGGSAVVAADVTEPLLELRQDRLIEVAMPFDTPAGADTKPFVGPLRPGGTDDGHL